MSQSEQNYLDLLRRVLDHGKGNMPRAGATIRLIGERCEFNLLEGFPLITTRRMSISGILGELAAFLRGHTRERDFAALGCNYWKANASAWPRNRGKPELFVGRIYGAQWVNWISWDPDRMALRHTNQLEQLIEDIRARPSSRRLVITTYNPGELDQGCLPPCHLLAQFSVEDEFLDCVVYLRSSDLCLGLPSDAALYGALMALLGKETEKLPRRLIFIMGDAHIYFAHRANAGVQVTREPRPLPGYLLTPGTGIHNFHPDMLGLISYEAHLPLKYELLVSEPNRG